MQYIEENGLTKGYTSILYRTPDEDIGFWHENLKASLEELRAVKGGATQLEKSNILIKLRETLLDHSSSGVSITVPSGVSVFPSNMAWMLWGGFSIIFAAIFWIVVLSDD